jgi:hypothetical protein
MTVKERPILFSGPMVRAILAGTKTQTRRVVKPAPCLTRGMQTHEFAVGGHDYRCPYGAPGEKLWVRETWQRNIGNGPPIIYRADHGAAESVYKADLATGAWKIAVSGWRPPIYMPRAASRILLEITDVRVERLQEISDDDARAEGYDRSHAFPREWFALLWESIDGAGSWAANPWVWVVSFKRLQP